MSASISSFEEYKKLSKSLSSCIDTVSSAYRYQGRPQNVRALDNFLIVTAKDA